MSSSRRVAVLLCSLLLATPVSWRRRCALCCGELGDAAPVSVDAQTAANMPEEVDECK